MPASLVRSRRRGDDRRETLQAAPECFEILGQRDAARLLVGGLLRAGQRALGCEVDVVDVEHALNLFGGERPEPA